MYYDKRIRYLSYYESDIKLQNAGYVRFQVRDSLCQMIIYVKGPRLMGSKDAAVYLLSRDKEQEDKDGFYAGGRDNSLQKHLLGNLNICNGQGHCAVRMNAENMADSGLWYDEICGIRIELHEYQYLESQWNVVNFMPGRQRIQRGESAGYTLRKSRDDNQSAENGGRENNRDDISVRWENRKNGTAEKAPVEINLMVTPVSENLRVEKLAREKQAEEIAVEEIQREEIVTEVSEEREYVEVKTTAEQMGGGEEISLRGKPESAEIGVSAERMSDKEGVSLKEETPCAEDRASAEQVSDEENVSLRERRKSEVQRETVRPEEFVQPLQPERFKQEEQVREELSMQEMLEREARRQEEEAPGTEGEIRPEEQALRPDKWEQLKKNYPIVHPIREDEEYLKIAPKDFVIFTEKYQGLVHNSFLLHGYYNYKHLILGRKERDGRVIYYLGVPGTFHDREKTVAVMFGFEAFDGKREPAENGDFGYYLRRVEI